MADLPKIDSPDLGKKVGPLPMGAWIVIVGAAIGFYLYRSNANANSLATDPADLPDDSSVPTGVGEGPGWTYFPPPTDTPTQENVRNNVQWAGLAIQLVIQNTTYDAASVTQAITKYIHKGDLTERQVEIVGKAIDLAGPPPIPLEINRQTPGGRPGGGHQPKPPSRPTPGSGKWHHIAKGDTLAKIARRYYANAEQRQNDIFNANKKGANRPGPTDGFMGGPNDLPVGRWLWIPGPTK